MCPSYPSCPSEDAGPSSGRRLPRNRSRPQRYNQLNQRVNASTKRGTKNSFTGEVSTTRFVIDGAPCEAFRYRDTAEMNLAKYLEACPGVWRWGRRTSPVIWSAMDDVYETTFPFEVWWRDEVQMLAVIDLSVTEHPLWVPFILEMARGHVFYVIKSELFGGRGLTPDIVTLGFASQQPWTSTMPKDTVDLLLQHRATNLPVVKSAIAAFLGQTEWMSIQEVLDAVAHPQTYAQVMQMIWSGQLMRSDSERPLGLGTQVGLVRQRWS